MRSLHRALAVLVAAVWGVNFVVIDVGLADFPPLLFSALRFLAAALPAVFFVRRPGVALRWIVAVGLVLGVAKFGLLFIGMHEGMPAGLASLVLQIQAVFTAGLATLLLRERLRPAQLAGMAVAVAGIAVAAVDQGSSGPLGAFLIVVAAAAFWAVSNILSRRAAPPDALSWMVWVSLIPPLPLLALSLLFEGWSADAHALRSLSPTGVGAILYVAAVATLFGFGAWGFLLRSYDASHGGAVLPAGPGLRHDRRRRLRQRTDHPPLRPGRRPPHLRRSPDVPTPDRPVSDAQNRSPSQAPRGALTSFNNEAAPRQGLEEPRPWRGTREP
jgi:O-acetylserine/cysteine efflux transporter